MGHLITLGLMSSGIYVIQSGSHSTDSWFSRGLFSKHYDARMDQNIRWNGKPSLHVRSKGTKPIGIGLGKVAFEAKDYLNRRLRLTGHVKFENVSCWAGLWIRVDSAEEAILGFDALRFGPVEGRTDWKPYEFVLEVPWNGQKIFSGMMLCGKGKVWAGGFELESI